MAAGHVRRSRMKITPRGTWPSKKRPGSLFWYTLDTTPRGGETVDQPELFTGYAVAEILQAAADASTLETRNPERIDLLIVGEGLYVVRALSRDRDVESFQLDLRED